MNTIEAIKTRRNIKQFKADPIDRDKVISWLEAATFSPNHRMTEPWKVAFVGPETRAKLNHKTDFGGAPLVLLLTSKGSAMPIEKEENAYAVACFAQSFMLAAASEGAGTFWSSLAAAPKMREILEVPDEDVVIGIFGVGYPQEVPEAKERISIAEKIVELP
ncbi:nitroreductase family protein [Cohnella thailandensis]|jgi:Nitroreductase|uniref:Nitroreductase family protein n=1 Tax=Cohnella thailandensis TaxID=557557 RepID=A0A841SWM0_9BACL|nr:nitroreductase family protein [Cohnella thailandensis]MBB6635632.1 nitroreductase family protein [Cohnella thailandensis]MBP1975012.1 nitroreductase [Cohnella thailandensis]